MTQQIWAHNIKNEDSLPFCVQTIGKNGSTRLHKWLLEYQFKNCTYNQVTSSQHHKDNLTYVFIQDPVVKFIKGFAELISNLRPAYSVGAIDNQPQSSQTIVAAPATEHIVFKKIITKMPVDTIDTFLFQFLQNMDMYKYDYHLLLQTLIIRLLGMNNLSYEVLSVSDIDNFHNIVMEKYPKQFKSIEFIWPDGFKPIEPERSEDLDRELIEERVSKLVYEHMDGDLSCIKEYLQPDIGLWEIFKQDA